MQASSRLQQLRRAKAQLIVANAAARRSTVRAKSAEALACVNLAIAMLERRNASTYAVRSGGARRYRTTESRADRMLEIDRDRLRLDDALVEGIARRHGHAS